MMEAIPENWFSWNFAVMEGTKRIADLDISSWREKGQLEVSGISFEIYREGLARGAFLLETNGSELAIAEKPGAFHRMFQIHHEDKQYTLRAKSAFSRKMLLFMGSREIGSMSPQGLFTRKMVVDLPEKLPLPVRVFIIWLAMLLWKRDFEAGGTGGAVGAA